MHEKPYFESKTFKLDINKHGYESEITVVKCRRVNYSTAYWILCEDYLMVSVSGDNGDYFLTGAGSKKYEFEILRIIDMFNKGLKNQHKNRVNNNLLKLVKKEEI